QASGQKVEWNEVRTLTLSRPDRLRVESERSNGTRSVVVFDGEEISTFDESGRVYAQAAQPGGVDETLVYFVRDLGMRLPLAVLFVSRAASELERRVRAVEYVERTGILGAPAHHLIGRTDTVNFQVWISDGEQPLPQRIVLTYPAAPGQPQFRAGFSACDLARRPPGGAGRRVLERGPSRQRRLLVAVGLGGGARRSDSRERRSSERAGEPGLGPGDGGAEPGGPAGGARRRAGRPSAVRCERA